MWPSPPPPPPRPATDFENWLPSVFYFMLSWPFECVLYGSLTVGDMNSVSGIYIEIISKDYGYLWNFCYIPKFQWKYFKARNGGKITSWLRLLLRVPIMLLTCSGITGILKEIDVMKEIFLPSLLTPMSPSFTRCPVGVLFLASQIYSILGKYLL